MPFLVSLVSRNGKAIAACLLASIVTVLLGGEPHRAVMAWSMGILIAAVALRARLRASRSAAQGAILLAKP
jgi:ABC-type transport system involved in cytochrome bd biosynthesis fused ATPase/permease subunit